MDHLKVWPEHTSQSEGQEEASSWEAEAWSEEYSPLHPTFVWIPAISNVPAQEANAQIEGDGEADQSTNRQPGCNSQEIQEDAVLSEILEYGTNYYEEIMG
jgi:hypothetical protein